DDDAAVGAAGDHAIEQQLAYKQTGDAGVQLAPGPKGVAAGLGIDRHQRELFGEEHHRDARARVNRREAWRRAETSRRHATSTRNEVWRPRRSKSVSAWSTGTSARTAVAAMRQSISFRTVSPRVRQVR